MRSARSLCLSLCASLALASLSSGCGRKDTPQALGESPPPPPPSQRVAVVGSKRFAVDAVGKTSVLIDAPLEKFKGTTTVMSGVLDVNLGELKASSGEVACDLDAFTSSTFEDKDKNESQTEHARNWFEIGKDVDAKVRDDHRMARFSIEKVEESSARALSEVPEKDGVRTVTVKVSGKLRVHGRAAPKTATVELAFKGPPEAPTEVAFRTKEAVFASLAEHDVKPRDVAGRFLQGALEQVGKKIDDKAQITVEGTAHPK